MIKRSTKKGPWKIGKQNVATKTKLKQNKTRNKKKYNIFLYEFDNRNNNS